MSKFLDIIEYFGINAQQRKLQEEIFELQETIIKNDSLDNIKEELADCFVVLNQIKEYYNIQDEELRKVMNEKVERTITRIKNKYY